MFRSWDFERGVLAFMLLLILSGVVFIVWQDAVADSLQARLGTAESQIKQIGELASQVFDLQRDLADDVVANNKVGPYAYIEQQEVDSRIGKRFNNQTPVVTPHPSDGYEDIAYTLNVAQQDFDFSRREIAQFLLYVEGNTTRMKVTHVTLDQSQRRGADKDSWKPRFTITDRHPMAKP
jgi:hypothetical protein